MIWRVSGGKQSSLNRHAIQIFSEKSNESADRTTVKAIHVTGCGGLYSCEMLRFSHCLDNRLIDGGKVVSPTHRSHFILQKLFLIFPVLISVRG
jgi:hypothetical protein